MTPEQWERARKLFEEALGVETARRSAFLDAACRGDAQLRAEVEELLAEDDITGGFMNEPLVHLEARPLSAGERLGPYEILSAIGAGGMGEVYRARDTRLKRTIAIKVLPERFSKNPQARARFEREARAVANLNHPHICALYDIGQQEGIDYLVMEYLEGETLTHRLNKGPLMPEQFLRYAIEIAGALDEAHQHGIIHRDLKPSNVMLTKSGTKLLDFGVAKRHLRATAHSATNTMSLTTSLTTSEGALVGTPAYMSPEQARGEELDMRTDLFSFGAVLYEMATGRRPFSGASPALTMDALLNRAPTPPRQINPGLTERIETIITKALQKDRGLRYQSAAVLSADLNRLKPDADSERATPRVPERPRLVLYAATIFLVAVAGVIGWLLSTHNRTDEVALIPVPLTSYPGYEINPSFSPDGNQVAFQWSRTDLYHFDIYVKLIGASEPLRLTTGQDSVCPAWSPDGSSIAFFRDLPDKSTGVFLIPPIGGPERRPSDVKEYNSCPAWHPSGKWLIVSARDSTEEPMGVIAISLETGEKRRLTSPPKGLVDGDPAISPGGDALVFARGSQRNFDLYLLELSGELRPKGEPKRITFENRLSIEPAWMPDGSAILFCSMGSPHNPYLHKLLLSRPGWRPGKPERVAFGGEGIRTPAVSRQSRLAYSLFSYRANIWHLELNTGNKPVQPARKLIASTRFDHTPEYSPDGKRIAFASNRSGSHEIWVCDSNGSGCLQATSFGGSDYTADPHWSPDGRQIYFGSYATGQRAAYVINSDGGQPKRLDADGPESWSRDGKWIYFTSKQEVWKRPAAGGNAIQITRKGGIRARESPDGRFLYYLKQDRDSSGLWKVPAGGGEETQVLESVCCQDFAVVEKGIYFVPATRDGENSSIRFLSFLNGKDTTVASLTGTAAYGFSVSRDGRSLLYAQYDTRGSDLWAVENFH
jgi:serine/threonine protein kinase